MNPAPASVTDSGAAREHASRVKYARLLVLGLAALLLILAVAACATNNGSAAPGGSAIASAGASAGPSGSAAPKATPTPAPLTAASPTDPLSFAAWIFTPLFQLMFMVLIGIYDLTGNIGVAIIVLTLIIRSIQIPLFRTQIVSQRRMQMVQPELKRLQQQYKGDRQRQSQAQMELYKERGVNPAAGCLPLILSMFLLIPMYTVIKDGLSNFDPTAMLKVFGNQVVPLVCSTADKTHACVHTTIFGFDVAQPQVLFSIANFPIGGLALLAAFSQLIQSRMVLPPPQTAGDDPTAGTQRTMMYFMPLFMLLWSGAPAGLFIYWIVSTIFSIVQQYLIVGWGSMFPLFGWTPSFALDHTPRFPVDMPTVPISGRSVADTRRKPEDRAASAAATVRPRPQRGRQGRRGRRR